MLLPDERRRVGDDLAHYCRTLQASQSNSINMTLASFGMSGATLAGAMFLPGAKIVLLALATGLAGLTAVRTYDLNRRQRLIQEALDGIDTLSWRLKQ